MAVDGKSTTRRTGYLALSLILLFVGITITITQYKIPSILGPVMERFSMTADVGSWTMSVFTVMGIFLSLPTGSLAKRLGPKAVLLLGCCIVVAGSVLGAFAGSAMVMIASRAVEGIAFVFITVAAPLAITQYVSPDHQGTANGIWSLWICLGSVIGSTATPMVFGALGLTGTWLVYAGLVVLAAAVLAVFVKVPSRTEAAQGARDEKVRLADYRRLVRRDSLLFFVAWLAFNVQLLAVLSYTPTMLQSHGMDASLSGFAASLPGLLAAASCPVFGKIVDRTDRRKVPGVVALLAFAPATFLMLTQTGVLLWVGVALMGLVGYGIAVCLMSSIPQIAGSPALVPATMGVYMLLQGLGEFLGIWLAQLLLGPDLANWTLCAAVMAVIGLLGAGSLALCRLR